MRIPSLLKRSKESKAGFALIISLSLMAFVLLLVLSINTLVIVEQKAADIAKQNLSARQNALTGLQIAIGELQQQLGPDQRATASADILDITNNPYTLVWHSDEDKTWDSINKEWTTSGNITQYPLVSVNPSKLDTLINNSGFFDESALNNPGSPAVGLMTITNPITGALRSLKAEKRPLVNTSGATIGNYAWVAQDESLKANLKSEHGDYQNTDTKIDLVETSRRLSVFPYANASGVLFRNSDGTETNHFVIDPVLSSGDLNNKYFKKLKNSSNLEHLIANDVIEARADTSTAELLAPYRNHFTLNSKGLLIDAKNGGLRRDLSRGLDDQYFDKLHKLPVFGIDTIAEYSSAREALAAIEADKNLIADGINEPVGDQWKFFRDYYNFYRPEDNGLADAVSPANELFGLDDVTNNEPSTRMRFTNQVVARDVVHLFRRRGSRSNYARAWARPYESSITPDILTKLKYLSLIHI